MHILFIRKFGVFLPLLCGRYVCKPQGRGCFKQNLRILPESRVCKALLRLLLSRRRRPLITTANPPSSTSFILLAIQSPQPAIKTRQRTIPLIVSLLLLLDPTNGANVHERLPRPDIHYSRFGLVRKGRRRCGWRMRWQSDGEGALLDCARYEFHFQ